MFRSTVSMSTSLDWSWRRLCHRDEDPPQAQERQGGKEYRVTFDGSRLNWPWGWDIHGLSRRCGMPRASAIGSLVPWASQ